MDIAEQCSNTTASDRSTATGQDNDYSSDGGDKRSGNRRNAENGWINDDSRRNGDGRRQNNREFNVMRQDFGGNGNQDGDNNGSGGNRGNGGNHGHSSGNWGNGGDHGGYGGGDRGGYGSGGGYGGGRDHDSKTSCDVRQPQQLQYYPPVSVTLFFVFSFTHLHISTYRATYVLPTIYVHARLSSKKMRFGGINMNLFFTLT